jgi:hypothetical protein
VLKNFYNLLIEVQAKIISENVLGNIIIGNCKDLNSTIIVKALLVVNYSPISQNVTKVNDSITEIFIQ